MKYSEICYSHCLHVSTISHCLEMSFTSAYHVQNLFFLLSFLYHTWHVRNIILHIINYMVLLPTIFSLIFITLLCTGYHYSIHYNSRFVNYHFCRSWQVYVISFSTLLSVKSSSFTFLTIKCKSQITKIDVS